MKTQNTPENPAITRALAVLRAGLGIVPTEPPKPPPAPAIAAPVAWPKPAAQPHDVWFYFKQQRTRAEHRAS